MNMHHNKGRVSLQLCLLAASCMFSVAGLAETAEGGTTPSAVPQAGASQPQKHKARHVAKHHANSSAGTTASGQARVTSQSGVPQAATRSAAPKLLTPKPASPKPVAPKPTAPAAVSQASAGPALPWFVYDANVMPDSPQAVKSPDGTTKPFTGVSNTAHMHLDGKGNLKFDTSADAEPSYAKFNLPYSASYPRHMTLIARITGNSSDNRASDLEIALSPSASALGSRAKIIVSESGSSGLKVEKFDGKKSLTHELNTAGTHIYQLAFTQTSATDGSFALYVDGAATPVFTESGVKLRPTGKPGENYVGIGANSSSQGYQGAIDWAVWTDAGAFTPAQLHGRLASALGNVKGY